MSDWIEHAVWWQVYPLGFSGADARGVDRTAGRGLDALTPWLDYAVELGCSGLALGPVFASTTHGYDTVDHLTIDDRLGGREAFDRLLAAAKERGLRVLLDGVFNHVGREHETVRRALAGDDEARRWFRWSEGSLHVFEGHPGLVTLNHEAPPVQEYVGQVMRHWLAAGADGWRLDAAYAVPPAFWASVLPGVRAAHDGAYVVGEVIHGDYPGIVRESGLDSVTQYELWKAIWSSLNDRNLFELSHAIQRHTEMLATFRPFTFVGNHDVTRIASRLDDERHLAHAVVLLFTLPGTPAVYYGDEQAYRGVKADRAGGDDDVRPVFPSSPAELSRLGEPVYRLHQRLIGFRRRHPWLGSTPTTNLTLSNTLLAYEARSGDEIVITALNLGDDEEQLELPPGVTQTLEGHLADGRLVVAPHAWAVAHTPEA
jgi:cyclomaltodextrinase / maltogenic alpha-amylase / neopullulanase